MVTKDLPEELSQDLLAHRENNADDKATRELKIELAAERLRRLQVTKEKALKLVTRWHGTASTNAMAHCIITGLPIKTDLPPSLDFTLYSLHPLAMNGVRALQHPKWIATLSNEELTGLIITLLIECDKLSICPRSHVFWVRARLEVIASRNQLLDFIEWIANSLLKTELYYPKLHCDHKVTLQAIQDWQEWTYSIECYSFYGSDFEPVKDSSLKVKAPKRLAEESLEKRLSRLKRTYESSVKELNLAFLELVPDNWPIPLAVGNNILGLLKGKLQTPDSRLDNLLKRISESEYESLAQPAMDLLELRQVADSIQKEQAASLERELNNALDDILLASNEAKEIEPEPEIEPIPEPKPVKPNAFLAKLAAMKDSKK